MKFRLVMKKMMKFRLLALAFPALIILGSAFPLPETSQQAVKVKSMTVMVSEKKKGVMVTFRDEYCEYNKAGKETLRVNYKADGSISEKEVNVYDSYGNRIERKIYEVQKERKAEIIQEHRTYKYNAYREKTEESELSPEGKLISRSVFTYNSDGKKSSESIHTADGSLKKKHVYVYNRQKLIELRATLSPAGDTLESRRYTYQYH